jgi:hypothetical protein
MSAALPTAMRFKSTKPLAKIRAALRAAAAKNEAASKSTNAYWAKQGTGPAALPGMKKVSGAFQDELEKISSGADTSAWMAEASNAYDYDAPKQDWRAFERKVDQEIGKMREPEMRSRGGTAAGRAAVLGVAGAGVGALGGMVRGLGGRGAAIGASVGALAGGVSGLTEKKERRQKAFDYQMNLWRISKDPKKRAAIARKMGREWKEAEAKGRR